MKGLYIKGGAKFEKVSWGDKKLTLPIVEIGKQWNKRLLTSLNYSAGSAGDMSHYYIDTKCADANVFYSALVIGCNALRIGTGISYRHNEANALVSSRRDADGNITETEYRFETLSKLGLNIMIEDEVNIYKGIILSGRVGYQAYGRPMRSYMAALQLGYRF
ncbi:MAG: hypothetical protein EOP56_06380 [Sphingobacteriales bacterium]|nr:MAG: hypothetical protein EOP56_06380 [Sphingobacteriales bacterium]